MSLDKKDRRWINFTIMGVFLSSLALYLLLLIITIFIVYCPDGLTIPAHNYVEEGGRINV